MLGKNRERFHFPVRQCPLKLLLTRGALISFFTGHDAKDGVIKKSWQTQDGLVNYMKLLVLINFGFFTKKKGGTKSSYATHWCVVKRSFIFIVVIFHSAHNLNKEKRLAPTWSDY
jgi:hypothetical protein